MKALTKRPLDPMKPWFSAVPVGKNKLSGMVKEMCLEAGLAGSYTNHSLLALVLQPFLVLEFQRLWYSIALDIALWEG